MLPLRWLLHGLLLTSFYAQGEEVVANKKDAVLEKYLADMKGFLVKNGGFFHPNIEIRYTEEEELEDSEDYPQYKFGLFVKQGATILEGEVLFNFTKETFIPISIVLPNPAIGNTCLLAESIGRERKAFEDDNVDYRNPYMAFLLEYVLEVDHGTPAVWSEQGKSVLNAFLHDHDDGSFTTFNVYYNFIRDPLWETDEQDELRMDENLFLALSRARDDVVCPFYDFISHSNNQDVINVERTNDIYKNDKNGYDVVEVSDFGVKARRNLKGGEELFHSYGIGEATYIPDLGRLDYGIGSADIFKRFGIIEGFPQRWYFPMLGFDFSIRQIDGTDDGNGNPKLELVPLIDKHMDDDAVQFLELELSFVQQVAKDVHNWEADTSGDITTFDNIPRKELKAATEYLSAYSRALEMIVERGSSCKGGKCEFNVEEETIIIANTDGNYFSTYQCETLTVEEDLTLIENVQSAYQSIEYYKNPISNDVCLFLDGVYQQCMSYWPHYHELVVHKPAKYLSEPIKRVLFVGGGDSGPLNEFLKYPSLELAVGLELDQQVTRTAFKHFKSRPHFDDPRVQWWYGDASKSLLMLPKEYFGTFDVVVVDLSDTVFALSVSSKYNVIEAISLLLRPGGIFEMNELFFKKISDVFEYAIHYQFSDVPKICDQSAIFASNDIDFMKQPLTEHDMVEDAVLLVEQESLKTRHQFDRVHDFRRNPNPVSKKLCAQAVANEVEKPQEAAPGIIMIVEAENLTTNLRSSEPVRTAIVDALEGLGLHIISRNETTESTQFVVLMKEGYLAARLWPDANYCALDIHLWSSFEKHDEIKEAVVVKALGGDLLDRSTTSYRIVAGGMFGLSNWRETAETHGPKVTKSCPDEDVDTAKGLRSDMSTYLLALEMSFEMIQGENLTVAVFCNETVAECPSVRYAEGHRKVKQVIPVHTCALGDDEDKEVQSLCTQVRSHNILGDALHEADVDVMVVDWDAPVHVGKAVADLIQSDHVDNELFLIVTVDSKKEIWRRRTADYLRDSFGFEPVHRAHVLLNTTESSLELAVVSTGDPEFFGHLSEVVSKMQEKSPHLKLEIRSILGGRWREEKMMFAPDSDFTQVTKEDDYNNDDAENQMQSQVPLATQTVVQFTNCELGTYNGATFSCTLREVNRDELLQACEHIFSSRPGSNVQVYSDIGGDGLVCFGEWQTGTAVMLWDGRYQIDLNVWAVNGMEEIDSFVGEIGEKLPTLVSKLKDFFPRGHGRVVSFKEDILHASSACLNPSCSSQ